VTDPLVFVQEKEKEVAYALTSIKDVLQEVVANISKEKSNELDNATLSNHPQIGEAPDQI